MNTLRFMTAGLFLACSLLLCMSGIAQQASVKGLLLDHNQQPLPYATVLLKNSADSSLYKGEISNEAGEFVFSELKPGDFYVQVQVLGYAPLLRQNIRLTDSLHLDLGILQPELTARELQTVTVAAEKPFIEKLADKTVVNIENNLTQAGSSVMEVLEKLPKVMVDQDGNIRLKGKQGVIILIDGKPSALSGQDLANMLRGMSSANIQKIELITNPSAKWDAAGDAGIINIIMKKNRLEGFNGSLSLGYGQGRYGKYNGALSLNYKKNKWNFFLNYSYANRKGFNNLTLNRKFYQADTLRTSFITDNYIIFPFSTHTPRLGADYYLSDKTTVSVLAAGVSNHFNPTTDNHTDILGQNNEALSTYNFSQDSKDRYYNYETNVQVTHKLDSLGQNLTLNLDHAHYWNNTDQRFATLYREAATGNTTDYLLRGKQIGSLYLYSGKLDYNKPLKHSMTLEAGLKSSLVQSDKDMQFYSLENSSENFDTTRSSHFLYRENINAVYLSLNKKWTKFTVQAGLRAEQTLAQGKQLLNNQTFDRNYLQVFPTLYLDYAFNDKHGVNLNLGRRINRPGYEQMNPFKRLIDFTTYSEGNPYLLPQLTYNCELSYSYAGSLFVTLSYDHTTNNITDVLIQNSETKTTVQSVVNLAQLHYYAIDVSYAKRLTKWWRTSSNILSYYTQFTGSVNSYSIDQGQPSFYISSNNNFTIREGLTAECNLQYNHRNLYGVTLAKTTYNLSLGLQKSILKKKGIITVNVQDLLWKAWPRGITQFGNVNEDWSSRRDTRVVNVSLLYKFGSGQMGKMRRDTGADEEKRRI